MPDGSPHSHQETTFIVPDIDNDVFRNIHGSLRVAFVRKYFGLVTENIGSRVDKEGVVHPINIRNQYGKLSDDNVSLITRLYVKWRDTIELMPVRLTYLKKVKRRISDFSIDAATYVNYLIFHRVNASFDDTWIYRDMQCKKWKYKKTVKRGNDVYVAKVKEKLKPLTEQEPLEYFSTVLNDKRKRKRRTNLLYITGTINQKLFDGVADGWLSFGDIWNIFRTNISNQFGDVEYIRAWQSQKNGYPHFHALIHIPFDFSAVLNWDYNPYTGKHDKPSWRIHARQKLKKGDKLTIRQRFKKAWKWGGLDILCCSSTDQAFKDMLKYITRDLEGGGSDLTNAMVWYFGKQSYSVTKGFAKAVWGKNVSIDLAEPSNADLITTELRSNSNFKLISIEVFPILPRSILDFSYQSDVLNPSLKPDPPPNVVNFFENYVDSCRLSSVRYTDDGVQIMVYVRE